MRGGRRRGPPKRAPKNIFSPGAKKEQKKPVHQPPPKVQAIVPPTPITPPKIAGSEKEKKVEKKAVKSKDSSPEIIEKSSIEVLEEVIPETQRDKYTDVAVLGFIGGFLVMMILDVALG